MSDMATDELPFTDDTVFQVVEPDGATRIHRTLDDLAADIGRILDQDGREVFYGCDIDAWDLLDIKPITNEMVEADGIPTGDEWGYAARLNEDGELVETVDDKDLEKLMLLVSAFMEDGGNRTAQIAALKLEHDRTLDKTALLQEIKEEPELESLF